MTRHLGTDPEQVRTDLIVRRPLWHTRPVA